MRRLMVAVTCLAFAGCGGSTRHAGSPASPMPAAPRQTSSAADIAVVRSWADLLRAGRVDAAARRFAVPAIVENGTPPLRLTTFAQVRAFNASLPCGARLVRTVRRGRYLLVLFVLTNRPGGDCGSGVGQDAATAFAVDGGKISEWRRLDALPPGTAPQPPRPAGPGNSTI